MAAIKALDALVPLPLKPVEAQVSTTGTAMIAQAPTPALVPIQPPSDVTPASVVAKP
jgi:hypothetical protein